MKELRIFLWAAFLPFLISSCGDDDVPEAENEEEIITDVTLTFTPEPGGDATTVTASAQDPDGEGPEDIQVTEDINLQANTTYTLTIDLQNSIENESITEEIDEEDGEHMFFFGWTNDLFSNPAGDGNIDNRPDAVVYNDQDDSGLPLGLETTWTTGDAATGTFRMVLKHQPDIKTETSTAQDGETDVDLTWDVIVE